MTKIERGTWQDRDPNVDCDVEVDRVDGERVLFNAQGGGFVRSLPIDAFLARYKPRTEPRPYRRVLVGFDYTSPEDACEAYVDGTRWNGWLRPVLTRRGAEAFVKMLDGDALLRAEIVPEGLRMSDEDPDPYTIPIKIVDTIDGPIEGFDMGGCFCWIEVDE